MKTKFAAFAIVLAFGIGGWHFARPRAQQGTVPTNAGVAETTDAVSAPPPPEDFSAAEAKLKKTSELMQKQLVPLLAKMPEELKRAQDLIRFNDELLRKLAERKSMARQGR